VAERGVGAGDGGRGRGADQTSLSWRCRPGAESWELGAGGLGTGGAAKMADRLAATSRVRFPLLPGGSHLWLRGGGVEHGEGG